MLHYKNSKQTRTSTSTAFNDWFDIEFKEFMNLYKKCAAKSDTFLMIDTTLTSDNPSRFRKNI